MVDQTAASCSVQWVSCMSPILPRAPEIPNVPAAHLERAGLCSVGDGVDQGTPRGIAAAGRCSCCAAPGRGSGRSRQIARL
eukprot:626828-Pyramimonas_sp.AAC.1